MSSSAKIKVCACGASKAEHQDGGACGAFIYDGAATFAAQKGGAK